MIKKRKEIKDTKTQEAKLSQKLEGHVLFGLGANSIEAVEPHLS